jgi:hypothetical protein
VGTVGPGSCVSSFAGGGRRLDVLTPGLRLLAYNGSGRLLTVL